MYRLTLGDVVQMTSMVVKHAHLATQYSHVNNVEILEVPATETFDCRFLKSGVNATTLLKLNTRRRCVEPTCYKLRDAAVAYTRTNIYTLILRILTL